MTALIFPSFLMMILAGLYYKSLTVNESGIRLLFGFSCATTGIVLGMFLNLFKSHIKKISDITLAVLCLIAMTFLKGISGTLCCVSLAVLSSFLSTNKNQTLLVSHDGTFSRRDVSIILIIVLLGIVLALISTSTPYTQLLQNVWSTFGSLSLLMFGGGYVALPILKNVIVDQHHWMNLEGFSHAISLGQITPGPVMITASFIGYIVAGVVGAIIATIGMFFPSAAMMILVANFHAAVSRFQHMQRLILSFRV